MFTPAKLFLLPPPIRQFPPPFPAPPPSTHTRAHQSHVLPLKQASCCCLIVHTC
jgi:hypothetical protein